jgi:hypothetical protein
MIAPEDVELLHLTDDPAEAVRAIVEGYDRRNSTSPHEAGKADAQ